MISLVLLTLVMYLSAGIATGDWDVPASVWVRFILIAICAIVLIPIFQTMTDWIGAQELGLMVAFILMMLLIRFIIMPELAVADEWMATVFSSFLIVIMLYIIERLSKELFNLELFAFIG